ncbi:MAG: hypothetical protein GX981_02220 [Tissierellia bacterium]|nr:hypothetical protein [Tissierellia bacterium]
MVDGLLESLSKGFGGNIIFIFLILLLLCSCGDGKKGFFDGIFDNNIFFLIILIFIFGGIF